MDEPADDRKCDDTDEPENDEDDRECYEHDSGDVMDNGSSVNKEKMLAVFCQW